GSRNDSCERLAGKRPAKLPVWRREEQRSGPLQRTMVHRRVHHCSLDLSAARTSSVSILAKFRQMPTIPATMRAAAINEFGGSEVLRLHTLPVPAPAAGEVLIRIETA